MKENDNQNKPTKAGIVAGIVLRVILVSPLIYFLFSIGFNGAITIILFLLIIFALLCGIK